MTQRKKQILGRSKSWLKENASKGEKVGGRYDAIDVQEDALSRARDWQAKKAEAGYAAITWPKEFGAWRHSYSVSYLFSEEAKYNVPTGFLKLTRNVYPNNDGMGNKGTNERFVKPALYGEGFIHIFRTFCRFRCSWC